jgi:uncharacterized protein YfaS (alpha-2-macroglobulin family)
MKWYNFFSLIVLVQLMLACTPQQTPDSKVAVTADKTAAKTPDKEPEIVFDLHRAQQDHKGIKLTILDASERNREGRNSLAVTLSVPLDPAVNHQSYFKVINRKGEAVEGAWVLSSSGKIAWFSNTEPNSRYEVLVYQGLTAANGATLMQSFNQKIETRNLEPSVSFDTSGAFLAKGLSHGLPVVTVNVKEVNIDFFRIHDKDINQFLQQIDNARYYWRMNRLTQFGELVYSGRYAFDAPKNTRTKRTIHTGLVNELQESGVYFAVMQEAGNYENKQTLWFSVTDLGLHARQYESQIDVFVSSLKTGKLLNSIDVSLYDDNSTLIKTIKSDNKGLASFVGTGSNVRLIVAKTDDEFSVIETRKPALDLSEFDLGKRPQLPVELFIYAPRDLFRPGEMVDFNALIRTGDGRQTKAPVLNARIKRPDGSVVNKFQWQAQELGYYHRSWHIPASAAVGHWTLEVSGPFSQTQFYPFKVEEFLPERMKITFNNNDKSPIVTEGSEPVKVPILGEYLYGAPGSGNRVSTLVNVTQWRSPIETLKEYRFGDINENANIRQFELDDIALDVLGKGEIVVPAHFKGIRSPLRVKLISSLFESGGRPVTRVYSSLLWPEEAMIGIRSNYAKADGSEGPTENSRVKFDIVKADLNGKLRAASNLEVKLIREDRQYFWVFNNSRGWHYNWTDKEFIEVSQVLDIKSDSHASVEFPVSYGNYRIEVTDTAYQLTSSVHFFAGYDWYSRWQDANSGAQAAHPDKVTVALDKQHYNPGDIARVSIVPPTAGEAIVMVEGDGPLWSKRIAVEKEGTIVEIPVSDRWDQHNLYVTAVVLRPGDEKKAITPKRSFGIAHLALNRGPRKLQVEINIAEKVLPEQTVLANLNVKNAAGEAVTGPVHVTLAAVDVGVLSISDFETPDPFDRFFGQRAYTVQSRDIYDRVIEYNQADTAKLRFGGDMDVSRGGKHTQSDVQIVSLFSGPVITKNGVASIPLKLPDFNGQLRLMAVAYSTEAFGNAEKAVTVAAPVVTQIAMPRFLAMGDKATIALDINNLSEQPQQLQVNMVSSGPVKLVSEPQNIRLAQKQKQALTFEVEGIGITGQAVFDLTVNGVKVDDQTSTIKRRWKLGVRPPYPAIMRYKQKVLATGETFTLDASDVDKLLVDTVEASISVSSKANMNMADQLKNLLAYPYGCLEQTSSRAFPLTYATIDNQKLFGLKTIVEPERIKMITTGINQIATMQLNNGGYGLWNNTSPEEHWLTAYVGDFLLSARDMGIEYDYSLLGKTLRRLKRYVNHSGRFIQERWSESSDHYTFAYKAYAAYVLSRVNQAPLGTLRNIFEKQIDLAETGLPKIHLGVALIKMGDKKRGAKAIEQGLLDFENDRDDTRRYYGDYGSTIRDKAMTIHLLLTHKLYVKKALELSFSLATDIRQNRWFSTQERNSMFLAGIALESSRDNQWLAKVILAASSQKVSRDSSYGKALDATTINAGVSIETLSESPLFVNASIVGYGMEKPQSFSDGLTISRQWFDKKGQQINPTEVKVGELILVHLNVNAEKRTPDALVVDLLPAGFELENQNLGHAIKLDEFTIEGKSIKELMSHTEIKHQEYRDDRFVAALDVSNYRGANLFYLLRAVTPGTYIVPSPLVEDMYNPQKRGVGDTLDPVTIKNIR